MELLPIILNRNGFKYTQVLRGKVAAIYQQLSGGNIISYEVFKIETRQHTEIFGRIYPDREIFPRNEDFGYNAWSIIDYKKAFEKFKNLEYESYST